MKAIEAGDVVKLKSGGKPMVVESIESTQAWVIAECDGRMVRSQVGLVVLEVVSPAKGGVTVMIV